MIAEQLTIKRLDRYFNEHSITSTATLTARLLREVEKAHRHDFVGLRVIIDFGSFFTSQPLVPHITAESIIHLQSFFNNTDIQVPFKCLIGLDLRLLIPTELIAILTTLSSFKFNRTQIRLPIHPMGQHMSAGLGEAACMSTLAVMWAQLSNHGESSSRIQAEHQQMQMRLNTMAMEKTQLQEQITHLLAAQKAAKAKGEMEIDVGEGAPVAPSGQKDTEYAQKVPTSGDAGQAPSSLSHTPPSGPASAANNAGSAVSSHLSHSGLNGEAAAGSSSHHASHSSHHASHSSHHAHPLPLPAASSMSSSSESLEPLLDDAVLAIHGDPASLVPAEGSSSTATIGRSKSKSRSNSNSRSRSRRSSTQSLSPSAQSIIPAVTEKEMVRMRGLSPISEHAQEREPGSPSSLHEDRDPTVSSSDTAGSGEKGAVVSLGDGEDNARSLAPDEDGEVKSNEDGVELLHLIEREILERTEPESSERQ